MSDLADPIRSVRLELHPLRVADAAEMHPVLAASALYEFTGGEGPTLAELENRYSLQIGGDPIGNERWLNWIVRLHRDGTAIGFVQATIADDATELAWLIGVDFQGSGFATESVAAMRAHLEACDITSFRATIHPDHIASQRVASAVGFIATEEVNDGEIVWVGSAHELDQ